MQLVVSAKPREYYNIGLETLQNQLERREGRRLTALGTRRAIEGLDPIELCSVGSTTLGEDLDRRIEQRHMLTAPSQSVENESHDSTASSSEMWEDVSDSLDSETFDDSLMESNYTASRGRSRSSRPRINASRVDPLRQPDIISLSNPMPQDGNREGLRIIDRVDRSRLQGVDYDISKLGLASNNKGISTVGPIEDTDARAAFAREVPQEVSADTDRDDVSSIGGVSYLKGRVRDLERQNRMKDDGKFQVRQLGSKVGFEARKRDLEVLKAQRVQGKSDLEIAIPSISRASNENVLSEEEWSAKRSVLELFFIGVISLSLLTLIILLGFMLAKR